MPASDRRAELAEWIAIPSVSADPEHAADVDRALDWLVDRLHAAGGEAERIAFDGKPLTVGELRAREADAPTVLVYGHADVQPADPLELWESAPFELVERDGWLFGRGVADDKGQLYMLLAAARELAEAEELPVHVRFLVDGEEEVGGHTAVDFLGQDERGADACVIFDSQMPEHDAPAFYIATRGLIYFHLELRTGERDLHSGVYGGAALNAMHALVETLSAVMPRDGAVPAELRVGVVPPSEEELAALTQLEPGAAVLAAQGAQPSDGRAADEFYLRTWAEPALDVNGIAGGSPRLQKTVLPVFAEANLSVRLAPGQQVDTIAAAVVALLEQACPAGADLRVERLSSSPAGLVDPSASAVQLGLEAFERALGRRPLLLRSGGTIPIVPALTERGIPTLLTGFDVPEGNIHSPNERLRADYLERGIDAARELLLGLRALSR